MATLSIRRLIKQYEHTTAVKDVTMDAADGEFVILLGPSGCGKTTTLRMIAGFIAPSGGQIRIGERDVTHMPPWKRRCGLVFQNYALFPHMTVRENIAFGLEMQKVPAAERRDRIRGALDLVRLDGLADRYPRQLSGGQQQRVAIARSLAIEPDVLLLDEPLSNLDAKLRQEVRVEIRELQQRVGLTTVMVTHDQEEALTMGDKLVVMKEGEIRQIGSQKDLYENPKDEFVAGFIGKMSLFAGEICGNHRFRSKGGLTIEYREDRVLPPGPGEFGIRPEQIAIGPEARHMLNHWPGRVEFVSYLGSGYEVRIRLNEQESILVQIANQFGAIAPSMGDSVDVGWNRAQGFIYAE